MFKRVGFDLAGPKISEYKWAQLYICQVIIQWVYIITRMSGDQLYLFFEGLPKLTESSKVSFRSLEYFRASQNVSEYFKVSQSILEYLRVFQGLSGYSRVFWNFPESHTNPHMALQ